MTHFIYIIDNKTDGKSYVGQTIDLADRWSLHLSKTSNCRYLHRAIEKYGPENFEMSIIEVVQDQNTANEKEVYWISELETLAPKGYNLKAGGDRGGSPSEETRKVMSVAAKNRRRGFDGEWRESMRKAQTGRKHPEDVKEKIRNAHIGIGHSEETKEKLRIINTGKKLSQEVKEKISKALVSLNSTRVHPNSGRKQSQETINKRLATLSLRSQCINGHSLSETGYTPAKYPNRRLCRECNRINAAELRARRAKNGNPTI